MAYVRTRGFWAIVPVALAAAWLGSSGRDTRADRIVLRGGGQIRGKVLPDPKHPDKVVVLTERGKTPLTFQKAQVLEIVPEPSALDDYLARRNATPTTAAARHELGLWCEEHKLKDLADLHYQEAVKLDKSFAPAHKKLGHVLHGDQWLAGDALREAQGLVRYKGKWITPEEKEQRDRASTAAVEQASWARRIALLREAIVYGADDRRREAQSQLMEIRDANAIGPLMKVLGPDNDAMRTLLAHVLGAIPEPEASTALVNLLLAESDSDVRHAIMDEVRQRKALEVTRPLVRSLRASAPEVVNRAAWALANLNAIAAVPSLIGALVTTRNEVVMAPSPGGSAEGSSISATFGSVPPTSSMAGAPIAFNGSSIGYLTPPVVGPGVVAFGATSVPYYPVPNPLATLPGGIGASMAGTGINAGGGVNASRGPVPRLVSVSVQNVEVLSALVKLTGRDFGYNLDAWRRWLRTSFDPNPTPVRRVPQP
jgi:hypothetical protein